MRSKGRNYEGSGSDRTKFDSILQHEGFRQKIPTDKHWSLNNGGAKRDRTADLYNAIVALSQLSYGPTLEGLDTYQSKEMPAVVQEVI